MLILSVKIFLNDVVELKILKLLFMEYSVLSFIFINILSILFFEWYLFSVVLSFLDEIVIIFYVKFFGIISWI